MRSQSAKLVLIGLSLLLVVVLASFFVFLPLGIPAHTGLPVITLEVDRIMVGSSDSIYIYRDGCVIASFERGKRLNGLTYPPYRTWKVGKISREEVDNFIEILRHGSFMDLGGVYNGHGGVDYYYLSVNFGEMYKKVRAIGFSSIADMPIPLNQIIDKIYDIGLFPVGREIIFDAWHVQ